MSFVGFVVTRLAGSCLVITSVCTGLLFLGNAALRASYVPTLTSLPTVCLVMLPLLLSIAVPLGLSLGTAFTTAQLCRHEQLRMLLLLPAARRSFWYALSVFALFSSLLMAPIVLELAPTSYARGKAIIMALAREQLTVLSAGTLHTPFQGLACRFDARLSQTDGQTVYQNFFWGAADKQGNVHIFNALQGQLAANTLTLDNGALCSIHDSRVHTATFQKSELSLDDVINTTGTTKHEFSSAKFLGFRTLCEQIPNHPSENLLELSRRLATMLWLLVLVFLAAYVICKYAGMYITPAQALGYGFLVYGIYVLFMGLIAVMSTTLQLITIVFYIGIPLLILSMLFFAQRC